MKETLPKTLALRVQYFREKWNLSKEALASLSNVELALIDNIEEGIETFLSTTIRQRLSKTLKIPASTLKEVEKHPQKPQIPLEKLEYLKENILAGNIKNNKCPACGNILICKIITMYDLEDNPVEHAKARCSKCPFQLKG